MGKASRRKRNKPIDLGTMFAHVDLDAALREVDERRGVTMIRTPEQRIVQHHAWMLNAALYAGTGREDPHQIFSRIVAPYWAQHPHEVRECGRHSGIPACCVEHFLSVTVPSGVITDDDDGLDGVALDHVYTRCPECIARNRRVDALRTCQCFFILGGSPESYWEALKPYAGRQTVYNGPPH